MPEPAPRLILASGSPRRLDLLHQLGLAPEVRVADIDESVRADESPEALVARLARAKAEAVRGAFGAAPAGSPGTRPGGADGGDRPDASRDGGAALVVLGADTIVVHGARVLGKPADREAFLAGLLALSGGWHRVVTAVAALRCRANGELVRADGVEVTTRVKFGDVARDAALAYWATGEPADKAGGYALQGLGARFVERVEGSPSGVVGLPLHETARLLDAAGVRPSYPPSPDG